MEPCQGAAYSSRIAASKTPSFMFGQVDPVRLWGSSPEKGRPLSAYYAGPE
jgi:hypothetical protein